MSVDQKKTTAAPLSPSPQPPPGNSGGQTVKELPGAPAPRTKSESFPDLLPTSLSSRTITAPEPSPRAIVNGRLASLIGKTIVDPALAQKCRAYFELDGENRIIGARVDVDPTAAQLNLHISEMGQDIARQNDYRLMQAPTGETSGDTGERATDTELSEIVGSTIPPALAETYLRRYPASGGEKPLVDGVGRVDDSIRRAGLTRSEVDEIKRNSISSLKGTNSTQPRDAPRIETEILFDAVLALRKSESPLLEKQAEALTRSWLDGSASTTAKTTTLLLKTVALIEEALTKESDPGKTASLASIKDLMASLVQEAQLMGERRESLESKGWTNYSQYHDNIVGRRFETELVKALVEYPPASVLFAFKQFGARLAEYMEYLLAENSGFCATLAEVLGPISTPYAAKLPHLSAFLNDPTPVTLQAMATTNTSGYDILKLNLVGAWLNFTWYRLTQENLSFAVVGVDFAAKVLERSRHATPSVGSGVTLVPQKIAALVREIKSIELEALYQHKVKKIRKNIEELNSLLKQRTNFEGKKRAALFFEQNIVRTHSNILNELADFHRQLKQQYRLLDETDSKSRKRAFASCMDEISIIHKYLDESFSNDRYSLPDPYAISYSTRPRKAEGAETSLHKFADSLPTLFAYKTEIDALEWLEPIGGFKEKAREATSGPGFGTALLHQPREDPGWGSWPLHPYKQHADVVAPSQFEKQTFDANRYIGRGASGSTILLFNAFRKLAPKINLGDAMVGTIMFMTFDGGHSIADSMAALYAYQKYEISAPYLEGDTEGAFSLGAKVLETYLLNYNRVDMSYLGSKPKTREMVSAKIDVAMTRTLEWFERIHRGAEQKEGAPTQQAFPAMQPTGQQ
jgi:hypothetical protein